MPIVTSADRFRGALWGMFIGAALAMPVYWCYDVAALQQRVQPVRAIQRGQVVASADMERRPVREIMIASWSGSRSTAIFYRSPTPLRFNSRSARRQNGQSWAPYIVTSVMAGYSSA